MLYMKGVQQLFDDGCQYVEKTFNVSTNQCVPGRQFPSIFQCAKD